MMQGDESFRAGRESVGATVLDFWRWSGSDLLSNAWRGVLAEFLVARALDLTHKPRVEWDAYDLETRTGVTVEVKSAAYVQVAGANAAPPAKVRFDIRPREWVYYATTNESRKLPEPRRLADVYVFCVLRREDLAADDTDPLDIDQWEFYVIARTLLDRKARKQKTIGIKPLLSLVQHARRREAAEVRWGGLRDAIEAAGGQR